MRPNQPLTPGQRIRQIREARGLSLRAAASKAGISPSLWRQVETGVSSPTIERAQAIAAVLGAALEELWPTGRAA